MCRAFYILAGHFIFLQGTFAHNAPHCIEKVQDSPLATALVVFKTIQVPTAVCVLHLVRNSWLCFYGSKNSMSDYHGINYDGN